MLKIFLIVLLPLSGQVHSQDSLARDSYTRTQFAGNIGFISVGKGWEIRDWFTTDLSLGYLPKHINGVRVFTVAFKPTVILKNFSVANRNAAFVAGSGINYSIGRKIFGKIPDYYPFDYYWPNAFHFTPFTGLRYSPWKNGRVVLFSELGTIDYKIWFAAKNREVNIFEILDLNLGVIINQGSKNNRNKMRDQ